MRSEADRPDWRIDGAHLFALWGFALVQPVLGVLPRDAEFFIVREVGGAWLVLAILLFVLVPPAVLLALELLAGRIGDAWRRGLHLVFVWLLASLTILYPLKDRFFRGSGWSLLLFAALLGVVATLVYARTRAGQLMLTVLAPISLLFLAGFFLDSSTRKVVFTPSVQLAAGQAIPPGSRAARTPIVMLVVDEFPITSLMDGRGRIDAVRYPNFARLARGSTWYPNTTAAADFTVRAVPAILTGNRPPAGLVPLYNDHPHNLFTLFGTSHRLQVSEHATDLCPNDLCDPPASGLHRAAQLPSALSVAALKVIFPPKITVGAPPLGLTWGEFARAKDARSEVDVDGASAAEMAKHPDAQFARFARMLDRGARDRRRRPPLYFFHAALPHNTWKFTPAGKDYVGEFSRRTRDYVNPNWIDDAGIVALEYQRHLLQVGDTDRQLGRFVSRLRAQGLYDRALFVVVADHGVSFVPGKQARVVTSANAGDVGPVPLFVKTPGQRRGRVDRRQLQTIDVLPTMADLLGIRMPWRTDGRPARELTRNGRRTLRISGLDATTGITISAARLDAEGRHTLRQKLRLFGSGRSGPGLYGIGPHRELVGRAMAAPRGESGVRLTLDAASDYAHVQPTAKFVPQLVTGAVDGAPAAGVDIAVVVNGRVGATAHSYHAEGGGVRYAAMLPPSVLRRDNNHVRVATIP
jgi:hypothetical protein